MHGEFTWADLSTYNTDSSTSFYSSSFGWGVTDEGGYCILSNGDSAIAGLYETPPFFKKVKMPHFWMSYFQVKSVDEITKVATSLGGKVELANVPFYNGNISLIRDPLGAGFTIYDGNALQLPLDRSSKRPLLRTELHVSDLNKVLLFYSGIFGWKYNESENGVYEVLINNKISNIKLKEIPNKLKGNSEYWAITFITEEMDVVKQRALRSGGKIISDEKQKLLLSDNSNEAFFYIQGT